MPETTQPGDVVLGANQLVVDIIRDVLRASGDGPPLAVLVDPTPEHWQRAKQAPGGVVVVVASSLSERVLIDAVQRGADAVLDASDVDEQLRRVVEVVRDGGAWFSPRQAKLLAEALRDGDGDGRRQLSKRESEILQHIAAGRSVKQTAREIGITPKTVENLQSRLFRKLEVRNRAQAVARAYELGLVIDLRDEQDVR